MKKLLTIILLFLTLLGSAQHKHYSDSNKKSTGILLTVGGVGFTVASILETSYQYGTYTTLSNGKQQYYIKPFWQQTPRQIMLVVGVSMTVTGLFTLKNSKH